MASKVLPSLTSHQGSGINQHAKSKFGPNSRGLPRRTDKIKVSSPDHQIQLKPRVNNRLFQEKPPTSSKLPSTPTAPRSRIKPNSKLSGNGNDSFHSPQPKKTNLNNPTLTPSAPITVRHVSANQNQQLPSISSNINLSNSPKITSNKSSPNFSHSNSNNVITRHKSLSNTPTNSWIDTKNEVKAQADAGNIEAMFIYANILFTGRGVLTDRPGARKYFQKAADAGHCKAQMQLADILLNGWGIPRNPQVACKYLMKAAETDNFDALCTLGKCYRDGIGVKKNLEEAEKRLRKGADQGHSGCQFELAQLLEMKGIEHKEEALSYYQKASNQGYPSASNYYLNLLNKKM
ncbi:hypothetical protein M9Y10_013295 [Tritrichomonas musculus]|uniref:Uncharacterized protein n=1 Tax=Tritrichomonas musculus TaxID=1915356 RepID=A0ABR2I6Q7_9EUKA